MFSSGLRIAAEPTRLEFCKRLLAGNRSTLPLVQIFADDLHRRHQRLVQICITNNVTTQPSAFIVQLLAHLCQLENDLINLLRRRTSSALEERIKFSSRLLGPCVTVERSPVRAWDKFTDLRWKVGL